MSPVILKGAVSTNDILSITFGIASTTIGLVTIYVAIRSQRTSTGTQIL
jgi:hypothetical protein